MNWWFTNEHKTINSIIFGGKVRYFFILPPEPPDAPEPTDHQFSPLFFKREGTGVSSQD